jgi:hypothetical protein
MRSAWWILWALNCQIHVVAGKHQAAISSSMNKCGTKHKVMLSTSKLNSSDSHVPGGRYLFATSTGEGHSQDSFFWLQNTEGLTLVGVFMEGTILTC